MKQHRSMRCAIRTRMLPSTASVQPEVKKPSIIEYKVSTTTQTTLELHCRSFELTLHYLP